MSKLNRYIVSLMLIEEYKAYTEVARVEIQAIDDGWAQRIAENMFRPDDNTWISVQEL
ncbi:MAG: hypothetical protein ACRCWQ_02790 [Bacilli bacterium]